MENCKTFEYFASANGYSGFRSYFDTIYKSEDFEKIIILQGGPGSGKSTLIKKAASIAASYGLYHEILRCSSDTNSLDGAIIEYKNKRVAILDGTAPHVRGQELAGVIDEIFNIGDFFNSEKLKKSKNEIFSLNSAKSDEYSKAYSELAYSSFFDINIKAEFKKRFNFKLADEAIDGVISNFSEENCDLKSKKKSVPINTRLISSFSKNGDHILDTPMHYGMRTVSISGDFGEELILIKHLADRLKSKGFSTLEFPCALDENYLDCLICDELSLCITTLKNGSLSINANEFFGGGFKSLITDIKRLIDLREEFKNNAVSHLRSAAEYHAELEKIYTPCIDFASMDKKAQIIYEKLLSSLNI